jgi:hypothetical protein
MCRLCPVDGCEVLVVGDRDLCARHYARLTAGERERLERLRPDGREVYTIALEAAVGRIEAEQRKPK